MGGEGSAKVTSKGVGGEGGGGKWRKTSIFGASSLLDDSLGIPRKIWTGNTIIHQTKKHQSIFWILTRLVFHPIIFYKIVREKKNKRLPLKKNGNRENKKKKNHGFLKLTRIVCVSPLILIKFFVKKRRFPWKKFQKRFTNIIWKLTWTVTRPINFEKTIRDKN